MKFHNIAIRKHRSRGASPTSRDAWMTHRRSMPISGGGIPQYWLRLVGRVCLNDYAWTGSRTSRRDQSTFELVVRGWVIDKHLSLTRTPDHNTLNTSSPTCAPQRWRHTSQGQLREERVHLSRGLYKRRTLSCIQQKITIKFLNSGF